MSTLANVQLTFDSQQDPGAATNLPRGRLATMPFPGLGQIIRLVEEALALGRTDAVRAHLRAHLPALILEQRSELPNALLQASDQDCRRFELFQCPIHGYQIQAMVWGPGQSTPIHDHNDQWGVEALMHGELQVARFRIQEVAGAALRLAATEVVELDSGELELIESEKVLRLCRNPSARSVAVSLQLYSRPMDSFGIYVDEGDGWHARREFTPRIETLC